MIALLDRFRKIVFGLLRIRTLGAFVLAVDRSDRVVLIRNSYGSGWWTLPGGGVKRGETIREAAAREAGEEAGVVVAPHDLDLLGVYLQRVGGWSNYIAVLVAEEWRQEPVESWEVAEVGRFDVDRLPNDTAPAVRRRIGEWRKTSSLRTMESVDEHW